MAQRGVLHPGMSSHGPSSSRDSAASLMRTLAPGFRAAPIQGDLSLRPSVKSTKKLYLSLCVCFHSQVLSVLPWFSGSLLRPPVFCLTACSFVPCSLLTGWCPRPNSSLKLAADTVEGVGSGPRSPAQGLLPSSCSASGPQPAPRAPRNRPTDPRSTHWSDTFQRLHLPSGNPRSSPKVLATLREQHPSQPGQSPPLLPCPQGHLRAPVLLPSQPRVISWSLPPGGLLFLPLPLPPCQLSRPCSLHPCPQLPVPLLQCFPSAPPPALLPPCSPKHRLKRKRRSFNLLKAAGLAQFMEA